MYNKKITMDIDRPYTSRIPSMQCDNNRQVTIKLVSDGKPLNLTGITPVLTCTKPDGTQIYNNAYVVNAEKGELCITLTEQLNAKVGQVASNIQLFTGDGTVLTTQEFFINVGTSNVQTAMIESTSEYLALNEALTRVNNYGSRIAILENGKMDKGGEISVHQINKSLGKIDQTFLSEELLQQMAGNAPINAVPADGSITENKLSINCVTDEKVHDVSISKITEIQTKSAKGINLYDKDTMYEQGHWGENGQWNPADTWWSSGYIAVEPDTTYTKTGARIINGELNTTIGEPIAFFDASKQVISVTRNNTFRTPANCYYVNVLIHRPGFVSENPIMQTYPYSSVKDFVMIVKGNSLPERYAPYSQMEYYLEGLRVSSDELEPSSIKPKHLDASSGLGTVYAGRNTPPEKAVFWFIPPISTSRLGFVTDGLKVCVDGRYVVSGTTEVSNLINSDDVFVMHKTSNGSIVDEQPVSVVGNRINKEIGYALGISPSVNDSHLDVSQFKGNEITIQVRGRVYSTVPANYTVEVEAMGIGSDPRWTGYYIKPIRTTSFGGVNKGYLQVDCNPVSSLMSVEGHKPFESGLHGKDVMFTLVKNSSTISVYVNDFLYHSWTHTHNSTDVWKTNTDTLAITIGRALEDIGSALIYDRALTEEEIMQNIENEVSIRGELDVIEIYEVPEEEEEQQ